MQLRAPSPGTTERGSLLDWPVRRREVTGNGGKMTGRWSAAGRSDAARESLRIPKTYDRSTDQPAIFVYNYIFI
ncbi:hypothetical protein DPMN_014145 [Dreissena polymorpha]|uniref:Uncharacterized protein n=1 Tax=Dreissena polymorpha TaxID=45954 RepID=A0A9D4N6Q6_DREPO|nr:hypothetical protein DPMN_014145 [Dreissena polymorpha]